MFNDLSIQEKAAVIKLGIGSGLRSLQQIEDFYNSISEGGDNASSVLVNRRSSTRDDGNKRNERRMTIRDWLRGNKKDVNNTFNNMMYIDNGGKPYVNGSVASMDRQPWIPSVNTDTGQVNSRPDTYYYDSEGQLHMYPGNHVEPVKRMGQDEIADFFWQMENPNNVGLNQDNGMYYKYRDPNGKNWDVGPGLVIGKAIEDKPYYTREELNRAAYKYHMDAMDKLAPLYDEKYGSGTFGNIDDRSKLVASDVMYRVGQNGVNPEKWPSMFDAINSGNTAMMLQQSRSKFKDKNNIQNYDNARVKRLGEYLYPGEFEYIFRNSLDPNIRVKRVEQKKNGGYLFSTGPEYPPIIQKVNRSKADFVQRLKDPNRAYIQDWDNPDNIATHKLSWADDGVVYPQVQNVNGRLVDFSRPPYNIWAGYDNAVRNGDTIHMTPQEAEWFTTHYKDYYPGFDEYKKGGSIHIKPENRGKFTALKKRTGHSASWFKKHGTPAQKKMATFALNARKWHKHAYGGPEDPPKQRFKTPEEILAEKYGIEPMIMDNVVQQIPVVTQQMKNEYANTPQGLAEQFGTIGQAEDTNAFQRKVREIRNSDNPMWFGAYFVPFLGQGMLLSNAAERFMSGQYGQGLFDTGLAFAPYLSKILGNTWRTFKFNSTPMNIEAKAHMDYPWYNWSNTTKSSSFVKNTKTNIKPKYDVEGNVNSWASIDDRPIIEAHKSNNVRLLKQPADNPFVDANGDINEEAFKTYMNQYVFGDLTTNPTNKFNINQNIASQINKNNFLSMHHPSPLIHENDVPVIQHMIDVAKSAQQIPLPSGIDRQSMVTTALFHDIGELLGRENHGLNGANILRNESFISNNPLSNQMLDAITNHMTPQHQNEYNLLQALRAADASRGVGYQESRLRWPSFYNYTPLRQVYDSSNETAQSNIDFMNRFNEYFAKYGNPNDPNAQYPLIQTNNPLDTEGINKQAKDIIARHNTFIRGVRDFKYKEDLPEEAKQKSYERMRQLGLDPDNRTDRINFTLQYYVPETGSGRVGFRPNEKWNQTGIIYTSNSLGTGAGYATSEGTRHTHNGEVALVRRPYKLGENRDLWMQEGDFTLRSNQEGPYYDINENAKLISNEEEEIRHIKQQAWDAWVNDPQAIQLRQTASQVRDRITELNKMRQELEVKFAPDDIKQQAYEIVDNNRLSYVKDIVNRINNILKSNNLNPILIPQKVSKKQAKFYENLLNKMNSWDLFDRNPKNLYFVYKNSKVTPYEMKSYGLREHESIGAITRKLLHDKDLVQDGMIGRDLLVERDNLQYEADQLQDLYMDIFMESYKPDLTYANFYKIPKSDELNIYTSEGIYRPSNKNRNQYSNYQHYLFPGPVGEKALNLVKWINRTEWVNNPDIKVTRGHHNIGGYPEATLKTFDLGGPIKPFSYLPIPEVRY